MKVFGRYPNHYTFSTTNNKLPLWQCFTYAAISQIW